MRKIYESNPKLNLFIILMIVSLLLGGCTTTGIHLFTVEFAGMVKENSNLSQPIQGVKIYANEKLVGETDAKGNYLVKVEVKKGMAKLTFQHPDYASASVEEVVDGRPVEAIQLPALALNPAAGEISGSVWRASNVAPLVKSAAVDHVSATPAPAVPGEYNVLTSKGAGWLKEQLMGAGQIIRELPGGFYTIRLNDKSQKAENSPVVKTLAASADVKIEPNHIARLQALSTARESFPTLWNMDLINAPVSWQYSTGKGVKVAILDTLYSTDHKDLQANILQSFDVYGDHTQNLQVAEHGMHVAGIIGAAINCYGVFGVAPEASLIPIRVFHYGETGLTAPVDAIVAGINIAIEQGVQVINMSFGMPSPDDILYEAIKRAYNAGIVIVAASGNYFENTLLYPAAYPEVIAVGAVGMDGNRVAYSNYGPGMELMAPGGSGEFGPDGEIFSTGWTGTYTWVRLNGTSMAAPHVSGVVALLMANGYTDPDYIRRVLRETAKDMEATGYDTGTGYGLVDAYAALNRFQNTYVFFGSVVDSSAQLRSKVTQVAINGNYTLANVLPGTGRVTGWVDVNRNLQIDGGDYLGESAELTVQAGGNTIIGIEVKVSVLPGDFSAINIGASVLSKQD